MINMTTTQDMATTTEQSEETVEDRYNRCKLLNAIQHIDIYGRFRSSYMQQFRDSALAVSSISSSGCHSDPDVKTVSEKLSKFSVTTRVSGLYPGHDILSKRRRMGGRGKSPVRFGEVASAKCLAE